MVRRGALAALLVCVCATDVAAQARIATETRSIPTYRFSEPDPIPILARDRRLYPYHSFARYAHAAEPRDWTVVHLENDWIELWVLPEVGGKVWGARVKATGHEFIYRNEVLKFRNIALRGPWTSGGIEFNFGVVGHAPSTATPVDWTTRENADGSVSCIVGSMDLPSRTHWRVEIRLPADRATFETRALWYNPTPLEQPYYNWMTAAAFARSDLEVVYPGDAYLEHPGGVRDWPVDAEGRYLARYANNDFGSNKSYHVVGEAGDVFGGYYRDAGYGFGHWARYEDMPGRKLWLWALSRQGGIWEDLLTDTDGQYVEFQAGRLYVQFTPDSMINPITQASFDPLSSSAWSETWFPVEDLGGLTDATPRGAVSIAEHDGRLVVRAHAFLATADTLELWVDGRRVEARPAVFVPLDPVEWVLDRPAGDYRVRLPALGIDHASDPAGRRLSRPWTTDSTAWRSIPAADRAAFEGADLERGRWYARARQRFADALAAEPWHRDANLGMAALDYRSGRYETALVHTNRVLQLDAYDADANFLAGTVYRATGRPADARDAFGWAARSMEYRAAANAELAALMVAGGRLEDAEAYARTALDYDRDGIPALRTLAVIGRLRGDATLATTARNRLLSIDPLHHFARAEAFLAGDLGAEAFLGSLGGEYPDQSLLEIAIDYADRGLPDDALKNFALADPDDAVAVAWRAYLTNDDTLLRTPVELAFTFPFRTETLVPLARAARTDDWRWLYLYALNLWAVDRDEDAAALLARVGADADFAPLYAARAALSRDPEAATADLRRAVALGPASRVFHVELVRQLQTRGRWSDAADASEAARERFPDDFDLDLLHARSLIHLGRAAEAAAVLDATRVLPSEHARESHRLYEQAHTLLALDALEAGRSAEARAHLERALEWPETLGQGRPYDPEERVVRLLLGEIAQREGRTAEARESFEAVLAATPDPASPAQPLDLTAAAALRTLGRPATRPDITAVPDDLDGRILRRALALVEPS